MICRFFKTRMIILFCAVSIICLAQPVHATSPDNDEWQFTVAPYIWGSGQKGTLATLPGLPPAEADYNFKDDIVDNVNGAINVIGEVRKGRYGVAMDVMYSDIEIEEYTEGPFYSSVTSRTKTINVQAAFSYRASSDPRALLDLLVGARYWNVDTDLTLEQGLFPEASVSHKEDWIDPLAGIAGLTYFGETKFFFSGMFMIGGFDVSSKLFWDATASIGYQWTRTFSTTVGYRYLDVEYTNDDYIYDAAQEGIALGLVWRF